MFPIDLLRSDTRALSEALDTGLITSESLVVECLRRIHNDNSNGLGLQAVLQLAPEELVLLQARTLDQTRQSTPRGPMHGIPILLKDSIGTDETMGMSTTAGSPALLGNVPTISAVITQNLQAAGMIILGKTNLTMLNGWYTPGLPAGWSALGGQTLSAYGDNINVEGSSTGSAVAVSAGFCPVSIGVESCGSIAVPAALAGVYAFKPSLGLVSQEGIIPLCPVMDCPGPMGKSVSDVASLLDVLTSMPTTFLQDMGTGPCPRIGLLTQRASIATSEEDELFEKAIDALGHNVDRSLVHIPSLGQIMDAETFETMWSGHSKEAWRKYLGLTDGSIRTLAQLVAWHDSHPDQSFHPTFYGQKYLEHGLTFPDGPQSCEAVEASQSSCNALYKEFESELDRRGLDILMYAGSLYDWPNGLGAATGSPIGVAPFAMKSDGTPFSITFVGRNRDDRSVLEAMHLCEQSFPTRPIPARML